MALTGQDSIFENIKSNVESNTADLITRIANTTVGEKTFGVLERAAAPYRDTVAPNLTAAIMIANKNYQNQNKDKSLTELFDYAKKDAVASSQEYYDNDLINSIEGIFNGSTNFRRSMIRISCASSRSSRRTS